MFTQWKRFFPIIVIILFSFFLFRNYFFKGLVPFPANLLVSYYEPWKSYPTPEYPNGPPNKAMGFDNVRIYYPIKKIAIDTIKRFQPPLWNPYNFSGNVLLATYQSAIFHPMSWLFLIIPQIDAWSITVMLQPMLAGAAMYIFLRVLGMSVSARFLGAMSYAFSGFFITWWQESYMFTYSALFLPVVLTAIELFLKNSKGIWLALLSVSLALSVLSGAFQMTFYVYGFTTLWILYRLWKNERKQAYGIWFGLAIAVSLLISAVHLIPGIEAYYYSTRIDTDVKYIFDDYLLPLSQLVTLIAPDYYGNPATYNHFGHGFYHERLIWLGIVPLLFVATQLHRKKPFDFHHHFFQFAFLSTLSLVLAIPTTWFILYHLKLPLLSTMTPSRMMMLVTFTSAVLVALGTQEYWKGFPKKTLLWITGILTFSFVSAATVPLIIHYTDETNFTYLVSLRNLIIPIFISIASLIVLWVTRAKPKLRSIGYAVLVGLLMTNSFLFAHKYLYFSERRFVYPDVPVFDALKKISEYTRFWTYDNGYIEKNFSGFYGLQSPEGYDSIIIRRYAEFLAFGNSSGTSAIPDRANAIIHYANHLGEILTDPYRRRMLDILGVRYILHKLVPDRDERAIAPDPTDLPRIWNDTTYAIHEYMGSLDRVMLYTDIKIASSDAALLKGLFDPATNIHSTLFLETPPEGLVLTQETKGNAHITSYTPDAVSVATQADGDTVLYLSDAYYPGWNAYIDGKKSTVYRANYAFRAVVVPKGTHTVIFRYEPMSWRFGVIGTMTGLLCAVIFLLHRRFRMTIPG